MIKVQQALIKVQQVNSELLHLSRLSKVSHILGDTDQ